MGAVSSRQDRKILVRDEREIVPSIARTKIDG
jgi:hypothetical protein